MRIGVIGVGALGSLYAATLRRAGHEVQVVARGAQRDSIAAHGIRVTGGFGESEARVDVVDSLDAVELCLVATKAHDTAGALAEHGRSLGGIPVLLVQNGVDGLRIASQSLPDSLVYGVISLVAANIPEPGVVHVTNPQPTFLGRGHGPADDESRRIASILNEGIPTSAVDEFEGALWTKLVLNMVNALPAITGRSVQDVVADRALLRILTASMREAARVGIAAGVRFGRLPGLDETVVVRLARWPLWKSKRIPLALAHGMGPIPNLASTLQSIRRGRPTEIEFLNGAIVRTAESLGQDAPLNRAITELVHRVESSGEHLSTTELRSALRELGVR